MFGSGYLFRSTGRPKGDFLHSTLLPIRQGFLFYHPSQGMTTRRRPSSLQQEGFLLSFSMKMIVKALLKWSFLFLLLTAPAHASWELALHGGKQHHGEEIYGIAGNTSLLPILRMELQLLKNDKTGQKNLEIGLNGQFRLGLIAPFVVTGVGLRSDDSPLGRHDLLLRGRRASSTSPLFGLKPGGPSCRRRSTLTAGFTAVSS